MHNFRLWRKQVLYDKDIISDFVILLSGYFPFLCKFNNYNNNTKIFTKETKENCIIDMDDFSRFLK